MLRFFYCSHIIVLTCIKMSANTFWIAFWTISEKENIEFYLTILEFNDQFSNKCKSKSNCFQYDLLQNIKSNHRRCSIKKLLKYGNIHSESTELHSLFKKVVGPNPCNFFKNRLQHRCFPVNITKFFKHLFCRTSLKDCASKILAFYDIPS